MKLSSPREKTVVSQIIKALRNIPALVVRKRHGTAFGVARSVEEALTILGMGRKEAA
jgi:hypothetical protein